MPVPVGHGKKGVNNVERGRSLLEELGRVLPRRTQIVRGATSLGIGFGSAGLAAGAINGSPIEGVLGTVVVTGSAAVRMVVNRRQKRN